MSRQTQKDDSASYVERTPWCDWLLAVWAAGIFAFSLRSMIEILS